MVIYDGETGKLYIPGPNDKVYVSAEEIYEQAFQQGYADGYEDGLEECQNNG